MKFKLVVLPQAENDIDGILDFLSRSPRGANAWYRHWLAACSTLKESADSFGVAPENSQAEFTVHQLIFKTSPGKPYRVLYRIIEETVYVYHVRGPGQDLIVDFSVSQEDQ